MCVWNQKWGMRPDRVCVHVPVHYGIQYGVKWGLLFGRLPQLCFFAHGVGWKIDSRLGNSHRLALCTIAAIVGGTKFLERLKKRYAVGWLG